MFVSDTAAVWQRFVGCSLLLATASSCSRSQEKPSVPAAALQAAAPQASAPAPAAASPVSSAPAAKATPASPPLPWEVPDGGTPLPQNLPAVIGPGYKLMLLLPGARGEFLGKRTEGNPVGIVRGRVDAETGKLEEFGVLGGVVADRESLWGEMGSRSYFDLDDRGRLALYVPGENSVSGDGEIRIWPPDQAGEPLPFSIPGARSGWLAWAADGRLLVANQGQLAAWDIEAGTKSLDFPGKIGQAAIAPSREWFVAALGKGQLEVFDVRSAKSLGRLQGPTLSLAVSPDGNQLAGIVIQGSRLGQTGRIELCDLSTGQLRGAVEITPTRGDRLLWVGERLLHVTDYQATLIDVAAMTETTPLPSEPKLVLTSPDGRLWCNDGKYLLAGKLAFAKDPQNLSPGDAVEVEADMGDPQHSQSVAAALSTRLKKDGFQIGASSWKFRVTGAQRDLIQALELGGGKFLKVPIIEGRIELMAPDGKRAALVELQGKFGGESSKYFKKRVKTDATGVFEGEITSIEHYEFGGVDPKTAMAEEGWERFIARLDRIVLPQAAHKTDDGFRAGFPAPRIELPAQRP